VQGEYESTESRKPVCTVSNENRNIKRERDRTIRAKQVEEMLAVFKLREPTQHTSSLEREVARSALERKGEEKARIYCSLISTFACEWEAGKYPYRGGVCTAEVYEGGSYHRWGKQSPCDLWLKQTWGEIGTNSPTINSFLLSLSCFRDSNIHTDRWQQPTGIIWKLQADPRADSNISFVISPHWEINFQ